MSIWLNEVDTETQRKPALQAEDRSRLRQALERVYAARQEGRAGDCALVVVDAQVRPDQGGTPEEALALLKQALQRSGRTPFALRDGQYGLLVSVRNSQIELQQVLTGLKQALKQGDAARYQLVFGAAMASETKLGAEGWLALADMRMQSRQGRLGLSAAEAREEDERRRYTATSSYPSRSQAAH
jgi:hypothetical protein